MANRANGCDRKNNENKKVFWKQSGLHTEVWMRLLKKSVTT